MNNCLNGNRVVILVYDGTNVGISDGINVDVKLSALDEKIIELLKEDNYITNTLIAGKLQKSIRTTERKISWFIGIVRVSGCHN